MKEFFGEKGTSFLTKGASKVFSLFLSRSLRRPALALGLFLLAHPVLSQQQFNGVFLSDYNPQVGQTVAVTVNWCDYTPSNIPVFLAVMSTATTLANCPTNYQNYFVDANGVSNVNDTGGAVNGFSYSTATAAGVTTCAGGGNRQAVWYLTVPPVLQGPFPGNQVLPGQVFYINIGAKRDSLSCASDVGVTQISIPITIFTGTPRFTLLKTAEDNSAAPNDLILFKIDYTFTNTNNFSIRDTVPANTTLVSVGPPGIASGAGFGATAGSGVTWTLGNTVAQKAGQVWMLVRVNGGVPSGTNISNTATGNSTEVGSQNSNTATSTVGGGGQVIKSESISSGIPGQAVTYTLDWNISGESLQLYDSYNNNAVGTANSSIVGFDGTPYTASSAGFTIATGPDGNNYIKAVIGSGFPSLLRNGPPVSVCSNYMVEGDIMMPPSPLGSTDTHMIIALNTTTCDTYMIGVSKDPAPANFFLQKKLGCGGGPPSYPVKLNNGNAALQGVSIIEGQWYTVKTWVNYNAPNATINSKVWIRGTPEPPGWSISYLDTTPLPCTPAGGGTYQIGWQGDSTADEDDYANLRYFAADPATNTIIYDTVPANLTYVGSNNGGVLSGGQVLWTMPTTIYQANGTYSWWATIGSACSPITNTASLHTSEMTSGAINSNSVVLSITGCGTPTNTATNSPTNTVTKTPTATATRTPTNSPTSTATQSPTNSPTNTATYTATKTSTNTATNTVPATATNTPTSTATNSPTKTPTNTATQTMTNTPISTATNTPTNTGTNSPTNSPTNTVTKTPTNTATNSVTNTPVFSPTNTSTNTATNSSTASATKTATNTQTYTATQTATNTPTNSPTVTATNSPTNSATNTIPQTATNTSTNTATQTATNSATNTVPQTATNTATPTSTNSVTNTPTFSSTNTVTKTPTNTVTTTATNSATNTSAATATNTSTNTAGNTATSTSTQTATNSPTDTFLQTSTNTATDTMTMTPTNTATNTVSNTPTLTSGNTATSTATNTVTNTPTDTFPQTATNTATNTMTSTPTYTATHTATNTATFTMGDTATSTATDTATNSATHSATGTPTNTATQTATDTPTSTTFNTATNTPTLTVTNTPTNTFIATATATVGPDEFFISKNVFTPASPVDIRVTCNSYPGNFSLRIYNSAGEYVQKLEETYLMGPWSKTYTWDGKNRMGDKCATGVYIVYLMEPYNRYLGKVVLINQ